MNFTKRTYKKALKHYVNLALRSQEKYPLGEADYFSYTYFIGMAFKIVARGRREAGIWPAPRKFV